jgi:hypothetical protein
MDEKMIGRFHHLLAKRIKPTIWPSSILESIGSPKIILKRKPRMVLNLGRSSSLPHDCVHLGVHKTKELSFADRCCGVLPILYKLPNNVVLHLIL